MQRRGERGQPTKGQRKIGPKARKAPIASVSAADLEEQLDRRTRELDEALRRSPADAQPVFDAIVQSAAHLCGAVFSVVYLCDGDHLRIAATQNFTPEATSQIYGRPELKRPDRSHTGGRAILDRASLVVFPARQTAGFGSAIVTWIVSFASSNGISRLFALTTTSQPFFRKCGFQTIDRASVPQSICGLTEFSESCCSSAYVMKRDLIRTG